MKQSVKKGIFLAVCIAVIVCIFPAKVRAAVGFESVDLYYYAFDDTGQAYFDAEKFCFYGNFTDTQKASILYENLFDHTDPDKISFVPEGTMLLGLEIEGDVLILNVSGDIKKYGGTAYETALLKQIGLNALNFPGVKRLTLMIDSNYQLLPEGKFVYEYEIGALLTAH
ncbi:MAG: GerMN domain-containing protein [Clostridiales bacterium]|jgi:spore germination protein GerM|nr:GerMN domain-containing protein [Clostridiales bacterium]